ncbi:MAG: hypothetical protein DMF59_13275 [Acidobacteria bacterium]|nr:MAG: hypothetical protein DMF59_13275 [Acidobacteriota bacterium]
MRHRSGQSDHCRGSAASRRRRDAPGAAEVRFFRIVHQAARQAHRSDPHHPSGHRTPRRNHRPREGQSPRHRREVVVGALRITDGRFGEATPQMEETRAAAQRVLRPLIERRLIPVMGGFIGRTRDGATTTLGRGGSDYSAAIIGAAAGADEIQIWTDVDGMMTADPRLIPGARVIDRISYVEAAELAWFGAKVLHPKTIAPAVAQRIPVRVLNTHNVASPGTLITEEGNTSDTAGPRAVAVKRGITVVHMTSNKMLGAHGFLARLFAIFEELEVSVDLITTSEVSVSVTIDEKHNLRQLTERLRPVADVEVRENQCIVAIVGRNLMRDSIVGARIFEAMRGIPTSMFSLGTSGLNLSIVVDDAEADRSVRAIHAALFEAPVEAMS